MWLYSTSTLGYLGLMVTESMTCIKIIGFPFSEHIALTYWKDYIFSLKRGGVYCSHPYYPV